MRFDFIIFFFLHPFQESKRRRSKEEERQRSETIETRTWTLVALRPATDAICWVAANIVLIDYMQKCAWMANFESFSKIYASESDSFFVFLRFFSPFVWLSFIHKNRPPSFQKKGLFAERASTSERGRQNKRKKRNKKRTARSLVFVTRHNTRRDNCITNDLEVEFRGRELVH